MSDLDHIARLLEGRLRTGSTMLRIDKDILRQDLGSVTKGLEFYHSVFARLANALKLKFDIRSSDNHPEQFFYVTWRVRDVPSSHQQDAGEASG